MLLLLLAPELGLCPLAVPVAGSTPLPLAPWSARGEGVKGLLLVLLDKRRGPGAPCQAAQCQLCLRPSPCPDLFRVGWGENAEPPRVGLSAALCRVCVAMGSVRAPRAGGWRAPEDRAGTVRAPDPSPLVLADDVSLQGLNEAGIPYEETESAEERSPSSMVN